MHIDGDAVLLIDCPYCGGRDEIEFRWGGDSHVTRPDEDSDAADWSGYLFYRENTKGLSRERWHHSFGCRRWFNVVRDTCTHAIVMTYPLGIGKPEIKS